MAAFLEFSGAHFYYPEHLTGLMLHQITTSCVYCHGRNLDVPALGKKSLHSSDFKLQNLWVPAENTTAVQSVLSYCPTEKILAVNYLPIELIKAVVSHQELILDKAYFLLSFLLHPQNDLYS